MYGNTNADDFGPLKLDALRCEMIRIGWSRRSINRQIARIKRVFKWAASKEHVLPKVFHALSTVAGLEAGRSDARETDPIRPVSDEVIEATLPFLSSVVAAMVRVQRLSGCRPGELCILRTADIDTTGAVWMYTPQRHKNSYRGMARTIAFGPKAQAVLMPFLKPLNPQAYIFSPADSMAEMRERRHLARKTPVRQGNGIGTARKPEPKRTPGGRYDPLGYHTAIARACDKALPAPEPLCRHAKETASAWKARLTPEQQKELADWQRSHRWHPHQLRHSAASEIRKRFGLEGAQVVLGHASANVSEIYAERDGAAASRVALEVG
jgi:integrase